MLRRLSIVLTVITGSVSAQAQSPAKQPISVPQAGSLAQLLDNGWRIQSVSGEAGQYLILQFHNRRWVRCELLSVTDPKLRYVGGIISDCRALN
jgi:hypothetical protein